MAPNVSYLMFIIASFKLILLIIPGGVSHERYHLPYLTPLCLGCICEATSNCNLTVGCHNHFCGPFLISKIYWEEAGRPVIKNDVPWNKGAFEACANEPYCAAQTVKNYISRFAQDCNGNEVLECDDYARIHYLGGRQCRLPVHNYNYYKVFRNCDVAIQLLN